MEKERFFYAVVSFMRKDNVRVVTTVTTDIKGDEDYTKFYPLMSVINGLGDRYKEEAIPGTVMVECIIEISKQDYDAYNERIAKINEEKEG